MVRRPLISKARCHLLVVNLLFFVPYMADYHLDSDLPYQFKQTDA